MEVNSIHEDTVEHVFRSAERRKVYLLDEPEVKFTRLRYLGGMTLSGWQWDLSYAHGVLPSGELVRLHMPNGFDPINTKSKSQRELVYNLVQLGIKYKIHMVKSGLREALSTLC